jgi:hypothetical protein
MKGHVEFQSHSYLSFAKIEKRMMATCQSESILFSPDSSDRCERAFKFTECFWAETKEVRMKSRLTNCKHDGFIFVQLFKETNVKSNM